MVSINPNIVEAQMCRKFTTLLHDSDMSEDEFEELRDELNAYKEQIDTLREDLKLVIKYCGPLQEAIINAASGPGGPGLDEVKKFRDKYLPHLKR